MTRFSYLFAFLMVALESVAQVGIGTVTPDPSSALDVTSSNSGLLPPRVSLSAISNATTPVNAPAAGLLVYNTNASVIGGSGQGYYYWNGTAWTKLSVNSDNYWSRNGANLYPSTLTNFVGIGTATPSYPLDVVTTTSVPASFRGGGSLYIPFSENGVWRGYFGSFAGADNDIEFGTYSGNTGALHLTTNNSPKLTVLNAGNVGIGTTTPTQRLDVTGKIRINDGTQAIGRVLSCDINGVGTWVNNTAITPAVQGVFGPNGATFGNGTLAGAQSATVYSGAYITLPPGKWMVFGTYLLNGSVVLANGASIFVRTALHESPTVATANPDVVSGGLISGILSGPNEFGIANGQTVINNSSGANKTYYMWANITKYGTTATNFQINGIGSNFWGENQLTAIPTN